MEMPITPTAGMPTTPTVIYSVTSTDGLLVGSTGSAEPVKTTHPWLTFTAWFAVGDSKETEILDGVAPVEGKRVYIDERGWLHVYVIKRDIEK